MALDGRKGNFLTVCILLIIACLVFVPLLGAEKSSTTGKFNLTPDELILNWTNNYLGNITLKLLNANNTILEIRNETSIIGNYSQNSITWNSKYYCSTTPGCFCSGDRYLDHPLLVKNATNKTGVMSNYMNETFMLIHNVTCPPGRYFGYVVMSNVSYNSTEHVNLTVTIDIPINSDNELNTTTGIGHFKGKFPANVSIYHSYYFNTSAVENATGVFINLSWDNNTADLDIFMFDSSRNLKAKSIKNTSEELSYNYLPSGEMFEIRIYGNVTSPEEYSGDIFFTTLNATNRSDDTRLDLIDFGTLNISENMTVNITLKNDGGLILSNLQEEITLYHEDVFNSSSPRNFSFIVPYNATNITVSVNWTGSANYTISLYKPNGTFVGNSTNKSINANVTNVTQEEFVETNNSVKGIWTIEVKNNTNVTGNYTVIAKYWLSADDWITSNYTTMTFNTTGVGNYTQNYHINFTVYNTSLNGLYKGSLKYKSSGFVFKIPLRFNVSTPVLLLNNSLENDTITILDNIGFNRTVGELQINVTINNTGNQIITLETQNSTSLNNGANFINFTYTYPQNLNPNQSGEIEINLTVNTTNTSNEAGIYSGWIFFNSSMYPYHRFNLTLRVNLTNKLIVNVTQIITLDGNNWIENITRAENITVVFNAYYINATRTIYNLSTEITDFSLTNISAWLTEVNTSYRVPTGTSDYLSEYSQSGNLYSGSAYYLNVTIPVDVPGGRYYANVNVDGYKNSVNLVGSGGKQPLIINDTGLKLTAITSTSMGSVDEDGSAVYFNITALNYGPIDAKGTLTMTDCSYATVVADSVANSYCGTPHSSSSNYFDLDLDGDGNETFCWYRWKIMPASNVSEDRSCSFTIYSSNSSFSNITGISLVISNVDSSSTMPPGTSGSTCSSNNNCASSYYCSDGSCQPLSCTENEYILDHACVPYTFKVNITSHEKIINVFLNSSNTTTVTVNNTGDKSNTGMKLDVVIYDDINATITPSSCSLPSGSACTFTVTFNVPHTTSIGNHSGVFMATVLEDTTIYDSKSFTLVALPTETKKQEINLSYKNYTELLVNLSEEFDLIKRTRLLPESNLTTAAELVNTSNIILKQIENAIAAGNYINAQSLINNLDTTLDTLKEEIQKLKTQKQAAEKLSAEGLWIWIPIGVIIAGIAAFFVYILLPPSQGYDIRRGFAPKGEKPWMKIKNILVKKKEKLKQSRHVKKVSKIKHNIKRKEKKSWSIPKKR